ncbi:methylated-DNA--[protein]-cysteine S-methyltransferase [Kordiimonas aestuarii]|uniref:methylated-DNA--[protein]-cysteine S-methyltransferase n=1 Tax=Kordiimonas aestuarii TaxID=1005925 RepID=UPI0021CEB9EC|nr:methylated-DNA--[protein]-cysteine S-methyltransferase [Kordiimonas aestuarii]
MRISALKNLAHDAVCQSITSPVGVMYLVADAGALHAVLWQRDLEDAGTRAVINNLPKTHGHPVLTDTARQLGEYFCKKRTVFDLPLASVGTPFQQSVWQALTRIPHGRRMSYEDLAITLGDRAKSRAVGRANGLNPFSVIIPCHRLVGKQGCLTGFAGGLEAKAYLLEHEARTSGFTLC